MRGLERGTIHRLDRESAQGARQHNFKRYLTSARALDHALTDGALGAV